MKASILSALYEADGYVSGKQLCDKLAVSRTAVWKVMNQLKEEGYVIESVPRKGYRILERPDCITAEEVQSRLQGRHAELNIVYYDRIDHNVVWPFNSGINIAKFPARIRDGKSHHQCH